MQQIATKAFASRVEKVPKQDVKPPIPPLGLYKQATHVFQVKYLEDPNADALPVNYGTALNCHQTMRNNFAKLTSESRNEFNERLLSGVHKGYWHLVMGEELEKLRQPGSEAHFLPSGYVLKPASSGSSTRVRLVLDPSLVYNQQLLPPVNIENSISSVLRKLQSLPICAVQDIKEAYFRLRLAESREKPLVFLMECEATGGENGQGVLTAGKTATSQLVGVVVDVSVMGISQSGIMLALCRAQA